MVRYVMFLHRNSAPQAGSSGYRKPKSYFIAFKRLLNCGMHLALLPESFINRSYR